jgi:hypothetical protein
MASPVIPPICEDCTEAVNDNYVVRTGDLYVCGPDLVTRSLGNIKLLSFINTNNNIEHRSGKTGAIDAVIPLSEEFSLGVTIDEITAQNMAYLLGQDLVSTVDGCMIPFVRRQCAREYNVEFVHTRPCNVHTITIRFWRALIISDVNLPFGETIAEVQATIRALDCTSLHPASPYGEMVFSEACPAS